eukprot:Nk52_evm7s2062 gene=Nk52_evmTU7s2062
MKRYPFYKSVLASILLLATWLAVADQTAINFKPEEDDSWDHEVIGLPGLDYTPSFRHFAGHLNVEESTGRNLFYWFVESQSSPETDPLVIWLSGGPGCSSLGAKLTENGPWFPNPDGKTLRINEGSWNKKANVIFLDSPSGVGFSYSDDHSDYKVGDDRTAEDTWKFLQKFLEKYTHLSNRRFFITGESYGGHYVPNLALHILKHNEQLKKGEIFINLEGFLLGNPWTDAKIDNEGSAFFWWTHSIMSTETYHNMFHACNFSHIGPLSVDVVKEKKLDDNSMKGTCDDYVAEATKEIGEINLYDIFVDTCIPGQSTAARLFEHMKHLPLSKRHFAAELLAKEYDPCLEKETATYLNLPEVQAAIHAKVQKWNQCNVNKEWVYSREDLLASMLPVYKQLLEYEKKTKLRMLVYSGDVDGVCPTTGTKMWLHKLGLPVAKPWRPWHVSKEVAGYVVEYEGLTFATVRDAGHMVPTTQPKRAYELLERFIHRKEL